MKGNVIYSSWDSDTYTAIVKKQTKYGTFTGKAHAHGTDKEIANSFIGYTIAEAKCDLQAFHCKVKEQEARAAGINIALKNIIQDDKVHQEEWWDCYQKLKKQACVETKKAQELRQMYNRRKKNFNALIEYIINQRKKVLNRIKQLNKEPF